MRVNYNETKIHDLFKYVMVNYAAAVVVHSHNFQQRFIVTHFPKLINHQRTIILRGIQEQGTDRTNPRMNTDRKQSWLLALCIVIAQLMHKTEARQWARPDANDERVISYLLFGIAGILSSLFIIWLVVLWCGEGIRKTCSTLRQTVMIKDRKLVDVDDMP